MEIFNLKKSVVIAIVLYPLWLFGQTTLKPVLSEGKSWEVATINWDYENFPNSNDTTGYYTISVIGDTTVNDLTCKKIEIAPKDNNKSSNTAVAYEENGKVWNVNSDGEMELIFDIGLHLYDEVDAGYVVEEDSVFVNGEYLKRLCIDSGVDCDDYFYYIVEGIGISSDKWRFVNLGICNANEYSCMLSCIENGETIFTRDDFSLPGTLLHGDVDGDGFVTSADISALYNYLLNNDDTHIATSDVNGDSFVTSADVTAVYNFLLGE